MENIHELKNKIISIIKTRGPSLPVSIAKIIEKSTIITSAFLSELASEKEIKISNMKVGGSPLYFLPGQEAALEKFHQYLPGKEREALILLQKSQLLQDNKLEPSIRVALRNLKDFAFPLALKQEDKYIIFWRYLSFPEEQAKNRIEQIMQPKPAKPEKLEKKKPIKPITSKKQKIIQQPLLELAIKSKKPKEKSEFVNKIIAFLQAQDIELIKELEAKTKEFSSIVRINTNLGKTCFLLIAKDKKKITENDLMTLFQKAQNQKMPGLLLTSGELAKKAQNYLEEYKNLINIIKL